MDQFRCSEDNFDANYICSSCTSMLCPKHFFSHQEKFPDHEIDHIKIPVNNQSRKILIIFVIGLKKKVISLINSIDLELWSKQSEDNWNLIRNINISINRLNLLILFVTKAQHIPIKIFYNPFEYFLHKSADKALKFVTEFKFPESLEEFIDESYQQNFLWFNYFNFEDKKYIFGWSYFGAYNNSSLGSICDSTLCDFLLSSEFEMVYEVLDNFISLCEIVNKEIALFYSYINELIYNFIKNKKISELIEQWKKFEAILSKDYFLSYIFCILSEYLFLGINQNNLLSYYSKKKKIIVKNKFPQFNLEYYFSLEGSHYMRGNYEIAMKYCKKFIALFKNNHDRDYLARWVLSWILIIECKKICGKQMNVAKIVKNINKLVGSFENTHEFDEFLCILNFSVNNFDAVAKIAWKLLKLGEKNRISLRISEAYLYLYLGLVHFMRFDYKKALRFLCNAKACNGIQRQDITQATIYIYLGIIYMSMGCYKDALYHFEHVNSCYGYLDCLKVVKIFVGQVNHCMQNYKKALYYFIEAEKVCICLLPRNHNLRIFLYAKIGQLYKLNKNTELENYYYQKAFLDIENWAKFSLDYELIIDKVYSYFLKKLDYEKCKAILEKKEVFLKWSHLKKNIAYKSLLFFQLIKLHVAQNKIEEASKYLYKVEKLLNIEKWCIINKASKNINIIETFLKLASIYIFWLKDFFKAEKICKNLECSLDINLPIDALYLWKLFTNLLEIYMSQEKWIKAKKYNKKLFKLLKISYRNEFYRNNIRLNKAEVKRSLRKCKIIAGNINKSLEIMI